MRIIFAVTLLSIVCSATVTDEDGQPLNDRPIIGVFAYPSEFNSTFPTDEYSYIAASYIKWVEQSGARVMPIPFDLSTTELKSIYSKINGILFPGGFWNIFEDQYGERGFTDLAVGAKRMLDLALQANYDGDYFPIYGIQSGMQLICALLHSDGQGTQKLFYNFTMQNLANNLEFMRYAQDKMWQNQDDDVHHFLQQQKTLDFAKNNKAHFFYSNFSMSVKNFLRSPKLRELFDITALSADDNGQKFVASIQGKRLPIYGTQFFSQGNIFEWKTQIKLDHHPKTIDFNQQLANFFVQDSRRSYHSYRVPDEHDELLIYNFSPHKLKNDYFEQIYFLHTGDFSKRLMRTNLMIEKLALGEPIADAPVEL